MMIDEEHELNHTQGSTANTSEVTQKMEDQSAQVEKELSVEPAEELEFFQDSESGSTSSDDSQTEQPQEVSPIDLLDDSEFDEGSYPTPSNVPGVSAQTAAQLAELKQDVQLLKAQLEDRTAQYMRLVADFENFRKRTSKEREETEQRVKCSTIMELLPVVDNFERARAQIKPQTDQEMSIHKSYQSVYKQLVDCLKRVGVSPMRAEGQEFDPNLHEAVMREPTDTHPEGTVTEELMRGYMLGDRVLRHAMVKVAAPPEPVIPSDEDSMKLDANE
jgi:molecular chaperone GrpE